MMEVLVNKTAFCMQTHPEIIPSKDMAGLLQVGSSGGSKGHKVNACW